MTDKPYTDAELEFAHDAFAKAWTNHQTVHPLPEQCDPAEPEEDCCDREGLRAALAALAATGRLAAPARSGPRISIERPDDERIQVHINGQEVASANHDEHGWSGMDAIERTALAVARACGARADQAEG
ncbi:hypothetical protein [Micromonospora sp. NPDC047730]|uniref:hypothetical protein n=1 Tax=Micromonospora sp. NPDC047730 TaxID=3364253 RepID=UPI003710CDDC